jgi:hypothetical protein
MDRAEELALPGMCGIRKDFPLLLQLVGGQREPIITEVIYERSIRSKPEQG